MKFKYIALLVFTFLMLNITIGQNVPTKLNSLHVGIAPLNLIDPWTPTLEGSIEAQFSNQFNIEAKYGFGFNMLERFFGVGNIRTKGTYYESKLALKYLLKIKRDTHITIAVQNVEPKFLFFIIPEYKNATLYEIKKVT